MTIVIDTNVWVSAFLNPHGTPAQVTRGVFLNQFQAALTGHLWEELMKALTGTSVSRTAPEKQGHVWEFLSRIQRCAQFVEIKAPQSAWLIEDPDDDWVIQCAMTAGAVAIVTGDRALRNLEQVEGIPIYTPHEFISKAS